MRPQKAIRLESIGRLNERQTRPYMYRMNHKQRLVPDALPKEIMAVQELGAQFSQAISWVGAQLAESRAHRTHTHTHS